jgi:hypothetical protein
MSWRIVVLSMLALGLTTAPVTAWTQWAGAYQTTPVATPPQVTPVATPPAQSPGPVGAVTRAGGGFEVTIHGGRWPYTPPMTPADAVPADPNVRWLALDVSVAKVCPESVPYSAAYFRVRLGNLPGEIIGANRPVPAGDLQPALGDGWLPASPSSATAPPRARGWVTFADLPMNAPNLGELFLDYVTPLDQFGDIPLPAPTEPGECLPLRRLSLPLEIAR